MLTVAFGVYGYDIETKAQSSQWKHPEKPRAAHLVQSNVKIMLTVFLDCNGVEHDKLLSQSRTVNKEYYIEVIRRSSEAIFRNIQNHGFCIMRTHQFIHR